MTLIKTRIYMFHLILIIVFLYGKSAIAEPNALDRACYEPKSYGSEANFNPITTIISGVLDPRRHLKFSDDLDDFHFQRGLKNVNHNLLNPFENVSDHGLKKFISYEVFPLSLHLDYKKMQFLPNYSLHLIGGGYTYRKMLAWYRWHDYSNPTVFAISSYLAYHYFCEAVESSDLAGDPDAINVDAIADMYLFNLPGMVLFSWDAATAFFVNQLEFQEWTYMPMYDPFQNSVENFGQKFVLRVGMPFTDSWKFFWEGGMETGFGLSYEIKDKNYVSFAIGRAPVGISYDGHTRVPEKLIRWIGISWDKNRSLMAHLCINYHEEGYFRAELNINPGVINVGDFRPTLFCALRRNTAKANESIAIGIQIQPLPIGVAAGK